MKKVGNSYVELGRGSASSSGNFVGGESTNRSISGSFTLQSSDLPDGETMMKIWIKFLWTCTNGTFTDTAAYHTLTLWFTYTPNLAF
jgi:hypothetical protein